MATYLAIRDCELTLLASGIYGTRQQALDASVQWLGSVRELGDDDPFEYFDVEERGLDLVSWHTTDDDGLTLYTGSLVDHDSGVLRYTPEAHHEDEWEPIEDTGAYVAKFDLWLEGVIDFNELSPRDRWRADRLLGDSAGSLR